MFRLGGGVIKGKQVGNRENFQSPDLAEIEKLIQERAGLREKAIGGIRSVLPFQVLAGQMDDIRAIRKPGDILNILSNVGSSPELFGALTKLPSLDLKMKEGELTDKITLAKLRQAQNKSTDYLRKKEDLKLIQIKEDEIRKKVAELDKDSPQYEEDYAKLKRDFNKLQERKAQTVSKLQTRADAEAEFKRDYKDEIGVMPTQEEVDEAMRERGFLASGGRVSFQEGTPMPMPKPQEAVQDRQLNTLMEAAPGLENAGEVKGMMMKDEDIYAALRRRLPQEITDDVVRLIAYNAEAFADFADISDQSDVDSFNEKYNVQLVLPVENVT